MSLVSLSLTLSWTGTEPIQLFLSDRILVSELAECVGFFRTPSVSTLPCGSGQDGRDGKAPACKSAFTGEQGIFWGQVGKGVLWKTPLKVWLDPSQVGVCTYVCLPEQ